MKTFRDMMIGAALCFAASFSWNAFAVFTLPAQTGPSLGTNEVNVYTLANAINLNNGIAFTTISTIDQTAGQANCTQLPVTSASFNLATSAGTGYVCLPAAFPGREIFLGNATGQTIDLYGSAATAVSGTQDTINGTTGTTAYTGLTNGKNAQCFSPVIGAWFCSSGS